MSMKIAQVAPLMESVPPRLYGGTERVIWDLGKSLAKHGHKVSYLVPEDSSCDFGSILPINPQKSWQEQIPDNIDIAHFSKISSSVFILESLLCLIPKFFGR